MNRREFMSYQVKASAMSIARMILGVIAYVLIQNGFDEQTANDFVSNNVELVAGFILSLLALLWIYLKNRFSNYAFWQAIFAPKGEDAEAVVDKAAEVSGLPKVLRF